MVTPQSPPAWESIGLGVGEEYRLTLKSLGSVGYRWGFVIEDGPEVVKVEAGGETGVDAAGRGGPQSSSGDLVFSVRGISPGHARVHFVLQRPWLAGKSPPAQEPRARVHSPVTKTTTGTAGTPARAQSDVGCSGAIDTDRSPSPRLHAKGRRKTKYRSKTDWKGVITG